MNAISLERHYMPSGMSTQVLRPPSSLPMENEDLVRRLRRLRRTVDMLQTDLRHGYLDDKLLAEIDVHLEQGIAAEPRCAQVRASVDVMRESTFTPRPELPADTIRACEILKDAIEGVLGGTR